MVHIEMKRKLLHMTLDQTNSRSSKFNPGVKYITSWISYYVKALM
jgi:hypothetical protein